MTPYKPLRHRVMDALTLLALMAGLLIAFGGVLAVLSLQGCGKPALDCPEGYHPNAGRDACVEDADPGDEVGDDPTIPNVLARVVYQDDAPVDLGQLVAMNPDPKVPPFQVIGSAVRNVLDPESGETYPTKVRDALTLDWQPQMPKNVRLVIDGAQWVDGHICTPCSGCVVKSGELIDVRDADGNMIPNTITIPNHPDGYCGTGHVPDCKMWPVAFWRPYLSVEQCCAFSGTSDQPICECPGPIICDEGGICECNYIP